MEERVDHAEEAFLGAMAKRYVWDATEAEALAYPDRTIRRIMDLGTLEDVLRLEPVFGRDRLVLCLRLAPAGALRPRSWWFWHYRLGLTPAEQDPPPMPERTVGPAAGKMSFFMDLGLGNVDTSVGAKDGDLLLASLDDLLGHKLEVLLHRVEAKDYVDIAGMLDAGQTLECGLGAAVALFPNPPPCEVARALTYFEGGDLARLPPRTKATLVRHVSRLGTPLIVQQLASGLVA